MQYKILNGDCLEVLKTIKDNSVDSIVTDPPYGLSKHSKDDVVECLSAWISGEPYKPNKKGFMGKQWDAWVPGPEIWKEALRVLKPGGHILAFAGTRSMDLMSMSIRLSGFELRDSIGYAHDKDEALLIAYVYGSGFPKSHNISKAIDKAAGVEREVVGTKAEKECQITAPVTPEAKKWSGFGTSLKPAFEPIILARKPLDGTVVENVLKHGTGGLNIDGCRIDSETRVNPPAGNKPGGNSLNMSVSGMPQNVESIAIDSRWPANFTHDGSDEVLKLFPQTGPSKANNRGAGKAETGIYGTYGGEPSVRGHNDAGGSAGRFFYTSKASNKDRNEGLINSKNDHPTVKPTNLMRYLCRLITPPGGTVLDPFMGSGSTGKGALLEEFNFIGIERDSHYCEIAEQRLKSINHKVKLDDLFQC
jgi:DNA modification methylase